MQLPGTPPLAFLSYLLFAMPWVAIRSARRFRTAQQHGNRPLPSRTVMRVSTLANQCAMFALAWFVGRTFGLEPFKLPALGIKEIASAIGTLAAVFGLRSISRAIRTEEERRKLTVYLIAPRTAIEWNLWTATVIAAGIAEETAYRGVGMAILSYSLGDPYVSALILSVAFAVAHAPQGGKSAVIIFFIAVAMHGLVAFTGTLVLAMIVHSVYDAVAGVIIAREAAVFDREALNAS